METLFIDIETFSKKDLTSCGVYSYAENEGFEILLFGYTFNNEEVSVVDLKNGEKLPKRVIDGLLNRNIVKTSFNGNFKRVCIEKFLGIKLRIEEWECASVQALTLGFKGSLKDVCKSLGIKEGKLESGGDLVRFFSINGGEDKEKWKSFKEYCKRDVEVLREIRRIFSRFPIMEMERELYALDQRINDRGVLIDKMVLKGALSINESYERELREEFEILTGGVNPKSHLQVKDWILKNEGVKVESLSDIKEGDFQNNRVVKILKELRKTSIKKYEAMKNGLCSDGRVRGLFRFYGANRTGRWAGKLVQVHNLPRNKLKDLDLAREIVARGDGESLSMLYESPSRVISELIRTAIIPKMGCRFIIGDFSSIEARIIAWISMEEWRMEVFKTHGKIYEASASKMFNLPIEEITKGSSLREKGKIGELALGFGGGVGALKAMGGNEMVLSEEELINLVSSFRKSNTKIVKLWRDVFNGVVSAVKNRRGVVLQRGIRIFCEGGILFISLPSGRRLSYLRPKIEIGGRNNSMILTYEVSSGVRNEAYGGKLVENIVQGIARDILGEAMLSLDREGYEIVMHIHDEVVIECENNKGSLKEVLEIMEREIEWAKGLPLRAEGFESNYYKKE